MYTSIYLSPPPLKVNKPDFGIYACFYTFKSVHNTFACSKTAKSYHTAHITWSFSFKSSLFLRCNQVNTYFMLIHFNSQILQIYHNLFIHPSNGHWFQVFTIKNNTTVNFLYISLSTHAKNSYKV